MSFPLVLRMSPVERGSRIKGGIGLVVAVAAATGVIIGTHIGGGGGGSTTTSTTVATPGTANVFMSTSGSDAVGNASCARFASPISFAQAQLLGGSGCATASRAYTLANFGDTVEVENGPYVTAQSISRSLTKTEPASGTCDLWKAGVGQTVSGTTTGCINFVAATSGQASWASLSTNANFLRFTGINMVKHINIYAVQSLGSNTKTCDATYAHDIIIEDSRSNGNVSAGAKGDGLFDIGGGSHISFVRDTFGNSVYGSAPGAPSTYGNSANLGGRTCTTPVAFVPVDHVLFDGVVMQDVGVPAGSAGHGECIAAFNGGNHMTIVNSKFLDCVYVDISLEPIGSGAGQIDYNHWTFENNYFDTPCSHCAALGYGGGVTGTNIEICHKNNTTFDTMIWRNNSFLTGGVGLQNDAGITGCSWPNGTFTGNIYTNATGSATCANTAAAKNVLLATAGTGPCGNDVAMGTTTPPYVSGSGYDFSLNPSTAGVTLNEVPLSTGFPPTDINGATRSDPADAGATEN